MKKGKFGIVLCFYPIAAFAAVILSNSTLICLALAAAAIFLEKDEWAGRQTLQAWMASVVLFFFSQLTTIVKMTHIPFISSFIQTVATILYFLVYLAAVVFSVLAIIRVCRDGEANFPLFSEFAYRIYGQRKPKPVAPPTIQQQYPMPYGMPQQPVQAPQQPYPPQAQNTYPVPPAPPQYAPPMAVQPPYDVQQQPHEVTPVNAPQPQEPTQNNPEA